MHFRLCLGALGALAAGFTHAAGPNSRGPKPKFPYDENTTKQCTWWYDSDGSDSCINVPKKWGITQSQFVQWNPSITPDCGNFKTGQSYCVEVERATTTTRPPTPTTTPVGPVNGIATPQPTQPGMTPNCDGFHLVQPGDTCVTIARANGITPDDVAGWNPYANRDCSGLRAYRHACTSVLKSFDHAKYKFAGWTVVDGEYSLSGSIIQAGVSNGGKALVDTIYNDFTMQMIVFLDSEETLRGNAGFVFRVTDAGVGADNYRGYYVGLDKAAGGVVIGRADKGWTQLKFEPAPITSFAALKVTMTGDLISVYRGSKLLTTVRDNTYRQGQIGVRAFNNAARMGALSVSPLVFDGFDEQLAGWQVYDGYFNSSGGYLKASDSESDGAKAVMDNHFANFTLEADVLYYLDDAGSAGVMFRASNLSFGQNAFEGYYTGFGSDGTLVLGRANQEIWTELQSVKVEVPRYRVNRIKVQAVGPKIDVYLGDMSSPKITVTDSVYSRGTVGARVVKTDAMFDNFIVQKM